MEFLATQSDKLDLSGIPLDAVRICPDCERTEADCDVDQCGAIEIADVIYVIGNLRAEYESQMQQSIGGKSYFNHKIKTLDEVLDAIQGMRK